MGSLFSLNDNCNATRVIWLLNKFGTARVYILRRVGLDTDIVQYLLKSQNLCCITVHWLQNSQPYHNSIVLANRTKTPHSINCTQFHSLRIPHEWRSTRTLLSWATWDSASSSWLVRSSISECILPLLLFKSKMERCCSSNFIWSSANCTSWLLASFSACTCFKIGQHKHLCCGSIS